MTVEELIAELQKRDPKKTVMFQNTEWGPMDIKYITETEYTHTGSLSHNRFDEKIVLLDSE
jgi:inhibitor of KinA sporulation pathway (predicted exonuclease)